MGIYALPDHAPPIQGGGSLGRRRLLALRLNLVLSHRGGSPLCYLECALGGRAWGRLFWLRLALLFLFVPFGGAVVSALSARVLFLGSRGVGLAALPLVRSVVAEVLRRPVLVGAGCAVGADALALEAVVAGVPASRLSVFCAFASSGAGSWRGSALGSVRLARRAGASLSWLVGGPLSVPLRVRLAARSASAVRWCAAGGSGSGLVAFLSSPSSPGSLGALRLGSSLGLPCVVWCLGFSGSLLPSLSGPGSWVCLPSGAWFWWVPSAISSELPAAGDAPVEAVGVRVSCSSEAMGRANPEALARWSRFRDGLDQPYQPYPTRQRSPADTTRRAYAGGAIEERMSPTEEREWERQAWRTEAWWRQHHHKVRIPSRETSEQTRKAG
jgi:hypothetical protein